MSTVAVAHIKLDENGVAWIDDTNVKVVEVVVDKIVHGSSPEEIHFQYPHLSLAQIHAALTYYYDHQAELDAEVRRRWAEADELAAEVSDPSLRQKLLAFKSVRAKTAPTRTYRRRKGGDTWHWCVNCSTWPSSEYEEKPTPGGDFCNECQARERAGTCHQ
ncbi:MAG TPA: DUF433 domain-containing protein [Pyrinomonadaceae bacterium]|nr:DUF433 domain-containing protein [Pyrinomonadaceae bacterium]